MAEKVTDGIMNDFLGGESAHLVFPFWRGHNKYVQMGLLGLEGKAMTLGELWKDNYLVSCLRTYCTIRYGTINRN